MVTIEKRIVSGADDVEQLTSNGNMFLGSSDLELVAERVGLSSSGLNIPPGPVIYQVGLRFTDLDIPPGAVITSAYIQFQADETGSDATSLLFRGLDSDDASPFTNRYFDLSSRETTTASASWLPPAWTIIDEAGAAQRSPDLSALVQEIVDRAGWQAGNDLGFVLSGSGTRTAESYEGDASKAPLLHIEYTLSPQTGSDILLNVNQGFRENISGATAGTLSVANPAPGINYVFTVADNRFEIVGNELKLKDGIRLDFERVPSISLDIEARASTGGSFVDRVTAPVIDMAETRFAAFGDYGNRTGAEAVAQLVNSLAVDFIITTGDNAYGSTPIDDQIGGKYSSYIGDYRGDYGNGSATNRFWPSIGNHDYHDGGGVSAYRNYFTLPGNELYYDFVIGPVHFFAIDSNPEQPDGRSSTSEQAQWLRNELADSTSLYNIVYFHHPPFSSGDNHGSTTTMRWPFEEWGATAVLSGHDHVYERVHRDDNQDGTILPYFITGLGGAGRYGFDTPVPGSQMRFNDNWGTMLIQASDDSISFEFIAVTGGGAGTLIDSYTIDLPAQAAQTTFGSEAGLITANEPAMFTDIDPNVGAPLFRIGADPMSAFDLF